MTLDFTYTGDNQIDRFAVFEAIRAGDKDLVLAFITRGYTLGQKNEAGNTELGYSIVCGQTEIACLLLDRGARPDELCGGGRTALLLALCVKQEELAVVMIEKGGDVRLKDKWNNSPIHAIKMENFPRAHQAVWRKMEPMERDLELQDIVRRDKVETLKLLVEEDGIDVVARQESLQPFVDVALTSGQHAVSDYILVKKQEKEVEIFRQTAIAVDKATVEPTLQRMKRVPSIVFKK